ncbi:MULTISPECIES: pyruvate, water dikinase regulatory protein [Thermoactinomyces]|jgi:[pyruvate, water dikinase]-phosphate phosphotransferase / [pyruvate, water dikinase] kinase|uniref:Putative pyruvate, phosphate dikinase regulatory protein n=1 Tax=Thermoactinomyces vulgaris TaxID=2026 RepID=A0ABS0QGR0_THEVU|nr:MULTISPECIES: pyruvate, water dikinase regulatory protein [Thermoactinomyces]KFZ40773.1 phosphotransferase [Thermoactinomyces sp. Gus2-1]KYQ86853.1 phosphoenolpyruvate synthase regulatory protein [Thermoactinomyces sp. AS95]MBA4550609.1 kinase/pyrophosphorylase [Thermoactinomyces vulgaris]MBA4596332.1 kinase/pyrophosphorylase [Thermoactinomyces vulgaris]MBH8582937.1 kinase/pyrophosphorylase [Thermoactinomyces sp. CICC 10735]
MSEKQRVVYVVSDSVGETAELVVKAASSQFNGGEIEIRRIPYVNDADTVIETVQAAKEEKALIAFTLVVPELQELLITEAGRKQVPYVDIMGPMIQGMSELFQHEPKYKPGLIHQLDEDYFRKVEAIEFAVKYDDGKDPRGLLKADVILVGVSRTSKTPLSMYLAHKRFKVANVPLVPEVEPPEELLQVPSHRIIGLTIDPEQLNHIRTERLKALGLASGANYASMERILEELDYAERVIRRLGCPVINVSNKAVEETANLILDIIQKGGQ